MNEIIPFLISELICIIAIYFPIKNIIKLKSKESEGKDD
jgi:hypothetical protein